MENSINADLEPSYFDGETEKDSKEFDNESDNEPKKSSIKI